MLCPVCKTVELAMADRQGIEIDYCPNCRGVWLDRGELDKIIERTIQSDRSAPPPVGTSYPPQGWGHGGHDGHHDNHRREDGEHGHHGQRRSFWKDLFD